MNAKKYHFGLLIQRMAGSAFCQRPTAHCKRAKSHNKCPNISKLAIKAGVCTRQGYSWVKQEWGESVNGGTVSFSAFYHGSVIAEESRTLQECNRVVNGVAGLQQLLNERSCRGRRGK